MSTKRKVKAREARFYYDGFHLSWEIQRSAETYDAMCEQMNFAIVRADPKMTQGRDMYLIARAALAAIGIKRPKEGK